MKNVLSFLNGQRCIKEDYFLRLLSVKKQETDQGRIQKIQREGVESTTLPLPPPPPRMKTSIFRTCSIQHCERIRDAK